MPLKIKSVEPGSLAEQAGIVAGDTIIELNQEDVRDFLDLEFYASDYRLEFRIKDIAGDIRELTIYRESAVPLGIIPQDYRHRNCNNHCIFCFIDQMPPGMRRTLYAKDDDYVFSYVFGNYITLNNLREPDIERICEQHISPLYVSLHTTNPTLRQEMIRSARNIDALGLMTRLSGHGISFHVQMVVVPGYNDGSELKNSLLDLANPDLNVESIGIVPVGITKYRDNLCQINAFNKEMAKDLLKLVEDYALKTGIDYIYPADEFYILADRDIPNEEFYGDYPQLENGIGMLRYAEERFKEQKRSFLKTLRKKEANYHFICSASAEFLLGKIVKSLATRLPERLLSLQTVDNEFFGEHVSVAGLITAQDILAQAEIPAGSIVVLPSCIFNHEGITLDGKSIDELRALLGRDILLVDPLWETWKLHS